MSVVDLVQSYSLISLNLSTETVSSRKLTYVITEAPREWLRASLPKHQEFLKAVKDREIDQLPALKWLQEERWEKQTGVKPEDTHFTVIVPIHNEEKFLPSFLGSLLVADLPSSIDAHVAFLTNACSDKSREIIDGFLKTVGEEEVAFMSKNSPDSAVQQTAVTTRMENITFSHVDTPTPGKANALNIGNNIALELNHRIAMSIDANNFVEPDVFRRMFARAYHAFEDPANNTVVISGIDEHVTKQTKLRVLFDRGRHVHDSIRNDETFVNGWCMGWDTHWLQEIGGMPQVAVEDYALSVYARKDGKKMERVTEAKIWGYNPNNIVDLIEQRARKIRGAYQILGIHPILKQTIENDIYVLQEPVSKIRTLKERIQTDPLKLPYYLADLAIWEYAKQKGRHDYSKDPTNQSWKPISSTKGSMR